MDTWYFDSSFEPLVSSELKKLQGIPNHQQLKLIKKSIKHWNISKFGNIDETINTLQAEAAKLDCIADHRDLNEAEIARDKALKSAIFQWKTRKYQVLRQYSRVKNISLKDYNTKYFHANMQWKKKRLQN